MEDRRRRPPVLPDAALIAAMPVSPDRGNNRRSVTLPDIALKRPTSVSGLTGSTSYGTQNGQTVVGRSSSSNRLNADLQRCLRSLCAEMETCLHHHQEEVERVVERQSTLHSAGWRSAPSDGHNFRQQLSMCLEDSPAAAVAGPGAPQKYLRPPPAPPTTVQGVPGVLAGSSPPCRNVEEGPGAAAATAKAWLAAKGCSLPNSSPRSASSTCTGSQSLQNSCGGVGDVVIGRPFEETQMCPTKASWEDDVASEPDCKLTLPHSPVDEAPPQPPRIAPPLLLEVEELQNADATMSTALSYSRDDGARAGREAWSPNRVRTSSDFDRAKTRWATPSKSATKANLAPYSPLARRRRQMMIASQTASSRFTRSPCYELAQAVVIVLNAIFVIWETQRLAALAAAEARAGELDKDAEYFGRASDAFCLLFLIDLALRSITERWHFFRSKDGGWNVFDIFVCFLAVAESIVQHAFPGEAAWRSFLRQFSMLRILRLLRVIRAARALKVLKFIRELRLMVFSLTSSLRSFLWSVVLILIILLVFGVYFTDGAIAYCLRHNLMHADSTAELRKHFGSLPASTLSLFMAMSGGEDWATILSSLEPLSRQYTFLFLIFISFAILALLNVVTAVFINAALQRSNNDRELAVQQELESKDELAAIIQQVFIELDVNHSGSLSIDEFEKHIDDEKIQAYLRSRQIDICQVRTIFALLDVDGTGDVDMEEFVQGVLRLKGGATSMDLAVLTYRVEYILHRMSALTKLLAERLPEGASQELAGLPLS